MEMFRYYVTSITTASDSDDGDAFLVRCSATEDFRISFPSHHESSSPTHAQPGVRHSMKHDTLHLLL